MSILAGQATVFEAGSRVPLSAVPAAVWRVRVQFHIATLSNRIWIGDRTASAASRYHLEREDGDEMEFYNVDLADLWIDADAADDFVTFLAEVNPPVPSGGLGVVT